MSWFISKPTSAVFSDTGHILRAYVSRSVPVARVVGALGCALGTLEGP